MNAANPTTIRLSITDDMRRALAIAKKKYPTLSDPEILKLGLSKIVTEDDHSKSDRMQIRYSAARAVGTDYLHDEEEDIYSSTMGERVRFS